MKKINERLIDRKLTGNLRVDKESVEKQVNHLENIVLSRDREVVRLLKNVGKIQMHQQHGGELKDLFVRKAQLGQVIKGVFAKAEREPLYNRVIDIFPESLYGPNGAVTAFTGKVLQYTFKKPEEIKLGLGAFFDKTGLAHFSCRGDFLYIQNDNSCSRCVQAVQNLNICDLTQYFVKDKSSVLRQLTNGYVLNADAIIPLIRTGIGHLEDSPQTSFLNREFESLESQPDVKPLIGQKKDLLKVLDGYNSQMGKEYKQGKSDGAKILMMKMDLTIRKFTDEGVFNYR